MANIVFCLLVVLIYCRAFSKVHSSDDEIQAMLTAEEIYCKTLGTQKENWLLVPGSHWIPERERSLFRGFDRDNSLRMGLATHEFLCSAASVAACVILEALGADSIEITPNICLRIAGRMYIFVPVCAFIGSKLSNLKTVRGKLFCRKEAYAISSIEKDAETAKNSDLETARTQFGKLKERMSEINAQRNQIEANLRMISIIGAVSIFCSIFALAG